MNALSRSSILFALVVFITALVPILGCPSPGDGQSNLTSRVAALEAALAATQAKLAYVSVQQGTINGVNGPHLIIEGCNLHVRSGSGNTEDIGALTGLGNVIVGYNEQPFIVQYGRPGSHNLVIGMGHEYANYGGFVAGTENKVTGAACSVSGGQNNKAFGVWTSVSGGQNGTASATSASVFGGSGCTAQGVASTAGGGTGHVASGSFSTVSGGTLNTASGIYSSISGGRTNTASGDAASVSGGKNRTASGVEDWVAGALFQDF